MLVPQAPSVRDCRVVSAPREIGDKEEPSPAGKGEGQGRREVPGSAAPKNLPAYGKWNASKVTHGTGEALPGPSATSGAGSRRSYKPKAKSASARRES